jgi:hypothetical protein
MPVPWEAFIPMGLVVVMFGVTGTGFNVAKRMTNDGKVRVVNIGAEISSISFWTALILTPLYLAATTTLCRRMGPYDDAER